jgi:hypothetical protein
MLRLPLHLPAVGGLLPAKKSVRNRGFVCIGREVAPGASKCVAGGRPHVFVLPRSGKSVMILVSSSLLCVYFVLACYRTL